MRHCSLSPVFALMVSAAAQDLVLVDVDGALVTADTNTLTVVRQGGGRSGLHALATDGFTLWGCANGRLVTIDRVTWATTNVVAIPAYQCLAWDAGSSALYGVRVSTITGSTLVDRIHPVTGIAVTVASWTFSHSQPTGLVVHQGTLFAWDSIAGLVRVDPVAGTGTPVGLIPGIVNLQFLCSHPSGRLLAGMSFGPAADLGQIDPVTGQVTTLGHLSPFALAGGVVLAPARRVFGQPCADAVGAPTLLLQGSCRAGSVLTVSSDNHALVTIGAMIFGFSTTSYLGVPLPVRLDQLLGTHGCSLYVSVDATLLATTPAVPPAVLTFSFLLPAGTQGMTFAMQHAALAPVPGSTSWSNAIEQTVLP